MQTSMYLKNRSHQRYPRPEREARTKRRAIVIQRTVRMFAVVLALCLFFLMVLICFKPWNDLRSLQHEKRNLETKLVKRQESLEFTKKEYIWISEDPSYFEMIARDRNDLALPHEKVYRIERPSFVR